MNTGENAIEKQTVSDALCELWVPNVTDPFLSTIGPMSIQMRVETMLCISINSHESQDTFDIDHLKGRCTFCIMIE